LKVKESQSIFAVQGCPDTPIRAGCLFSKSHLAYVFSVKVSPTDFCGLIFCENIHLEADKISIAISGKDTGKITPLLLLLVLLLIQFLYGYRSGEILREIVVIIHG
jgi:hypothetical protein